MIAPFIGIERHRLTTDGQGVTTLVAFNGCPLRCKYCLNPQSLSPKGIVKKLSPEDLLKQVEIDNLYFLATNGGVTFGGGEPLLYAEYVRSFHNICNPDWKINIETSLNVPFENLRMVDRFVNQFIVDVKDINPEIYNSYTGKDNAQVISNLKYLADMGLQSRVHIRIPRIPKYNTDSDIAKTDEAVRRMGFQDVEVFRYVAPEISNIKPYKQ